VKPQLIPLKKYYSMWRDNLRLKEENMKLKTDLLYLKQQIEELKSELVVSEQMKK
jgi:hypothetical protein